jgi:transposase
MRRAIPVITETVEELKAHLQREHDSRKRLRVQMLYLLASGHATERQQVAQLLGIHRNTIGRWLLTYQTGGLPALLEIYVPEGKQPSLQPDVLASIKRALHKPEGFASYGALREWVLQTHHVDVNYKTLYSLVRSRFGTKLKVPRPSHAKKTSMT